MHKIAYILIFSLTLLGVSCQKEKSLPSDLLLSEIYFPENTEIKDMISVNDSVLFVCGGRRDQHGYIYQSKDKGESWSMRLILDDASINCIHISDEGGYWAGSDSLRIWHSKDLGQTWEEYEISNYPWDNYLNPYHAIYAWNSKSILAIGGEYYQKGITSKTETGDYPWVQTSWDNQWFDLIVWFENNVLISGYGQVLYSDNFGKEFHETGLYGDAFIDLEKTDDNEIFVLGEHGEIFQYNNLSWVRHTNIQGRFNDMALGEKYSLFVGQSGIFFLADENLNEPIEIEPFTSSHLSLAHAHGNDFLIGTLDGKIYRLSGK